MKTKIIPLKKTFQPPFRTVIFTGSEPSPSTFLILVYNFVKNKHYKYFWSQNDNERIFVLDSKVDIVQEQ